MDTSPKAQYDKFTLLLEVAAMPRRFKLLSKQVKKEQTLRFVLYGDDLTKNL